MRYRSAIWLILVGLLLITIQPWLAACGSPGASTDGEPVTESESIQSKERVKAEEGGIITSNDSKVSVEIPSGALLEDTDIIIHQVNEEMDSFGAEYRSQLDVVGSELADVNRRLDRLYDALETGKLELTDVAPRIQKLRHRQDQLEAAKQDIEDGLLNRKAELADLTMVVKYVEDLRLVLMDSPLTERRAFIRSFVKEVKVTGEAVTLYYTIPLPPSGIMEEKAGVLSIVQYGRASWIRKERTSSNE